MLLPEPVVRLTFSRVAPKLRARRQNEVLRFSEPTGWLIESTDPSPTIRAPHDSAGDSSRTNRNRDALALFYRIQLTHESRLSYARPARRICLINQPASPGSGNEISLLKTNKFDA